MVKLKWSRDPFDASTSRQYKWSLLGAVLAIILISHAAGLYRSRAHWLSTLVAQSLADKASESANASKIETNITNVEVFKSQSSQEKLRGFRNRTELSKVERSHQSSCVNPRPLLWEWNYYSRNENESNRTKGKRLLIGLFSGYDKYAEMLELTAPINKAYARKWCQDLVVLQGTAYILPVDKNCTPPGQRVTLNKVALLRAALERKDEYEQLLILDTDAMMYDFDFDVTSILSDNVMVAAKRVHKNESLNTWNINAGVMLWNLHHEQTPTVVRAWESLSMQMISRGRFMADQRPLHQVLREQGENFLPFVHALWDEFAYGHGTVVKHFIRRPMHRDWDDLNVVGDREQRIQKATEDICNQYPHECAELERTRYRVS